MQGAVVQSWHAYVPAELGTHSEPPAHSRSVVQVVGSHWVPDPHAYDPVQPAYPELLHAPVLHMPVVVSHAVPFWQKFVL